MTRRVQRMSDHAPDCPAWGGGVCRCDVRVTRETAALLVSLTESESLSQEEFDLVCNAAARLAVFAEWLVAMDDPEDEFGRTERQQVTLTKIIERATKAING